VVCVCWRVRDGGCAWRPEPQVTGSTPGATSLGHQLSYRSDQYDPYIPGSNPNQPGGGPGPAASTGAPRSATLVMLSFMIPTVASISCWIAWVLLPLAPLTPMNDLTDSRCTYQLSYRSDQYDPYIPGSNPNQPGGGPLSPLGDLGDVVLHDPDGRVNLLLDRLGLAPARAYQLSYRSDQYDPYIPGSNPNQPGGGPGPAASTGRTTNPSCPGGRRASLPARRPW
jgi:hypothetical protein